MKGRKPIPTPLRALRGNPQHTPLPQNEPQPDPKRPTCPAWLDHEAKAEWRRVVPRLHAIGLLRYVDRAALATYCSMWSMLVEARQGVALNGTTLITERGPITNPDSNLAIKLAATVRAYCSEFGLTSTSRSRMQIPGEVVPDDFGREYGG